MPIQTGINRILDFELKANKNVALGYAGLDAGGKVPVAEIPDLSATYLPLIGGTMTGNLDFTGAQLHMNDNYISLGYQTGIQAVDAGDISGIPRDLTFKDSAYPAGKTLSQLVGGAGGPYLPLAGGTLTGDLTIDKSLPSIYFSISGAQKGTVQADANGFYIFPGSVKLSLGIGSSITDIYGSNINIIGILGADIDFNG